MRMLGEGTGHRTGEDVLGGGQDQLQNAQDPVGTEMQGNAVKVPKCRAFSFLYGLSLCLFLNCYLMSSK